MVHLNVEKCTKMAIIHLLNGTFCCPQTPVCLLKKILISPDPTLGKEEENALDDNMYV